MKKIYIFILIAMMLIGCGDTTTINGYTEDDVERLLHSAKTTDTLYQYVEGDSVFQYIYVTDTLYSEIVDTVVTITMDTVYNRVIDTVLTTLVDTVYTRVIDTVFSTLNDIGVDTELPRDTSFSVYDTNGTVITQTVYSGIVYKNVFYSSETYTAMMDIWYKNDVQVIELYADPCTNGFRLFNEADAYRMASYLNLLIGETTPIVLRTITGAKYDANLWRNLTLNVAYYQVPSTTNYYTARGTISGSGHEIPQKLDAVYVCAYDLE